MSFCQQCGKEIMDDSKFCNSCGAAITVNEVNENFEKATEPEVVVPITKKRGLVFSKKIIIIVSAVLVVLISAGIGLSSIISGNQYKDKLDTAYESMMYGADEAESYCSLQSKVWRNCIYKDRNSETDKYTLNEYGSFYSDFNDALSSFYSGESSSYIFISGNVSTVNELMAELKDCPKKYEEEYKAVKELYVAYSELTDLVIGNSSYSLNSFNDALENAKSDYKGTLSSARLILD